jgi:hypothetical protein
MCFAFSHIPVSSMPVVHAYNSFPIAGTSAEMAAFCENWHAKSPGLQQTVGEGNLTTLRDYVSIKLLCMGGGDMGLAYGDFFKQTPWFVPAAHNATSSNRSATNRSHGPYQCRADVSNCEAGQDHSSKSYLQTLVDLYFV